MKSNTLLCIETISGDDMNRKMTILNSGIFYRMLIVFFLLPFFSATYAADLKSNPEQVVTELLKSMEANDAAKIRSLFSKNATQEYERWWSRKKQGDDFREWLESDIIAVHGRVTNPSVKATGNEVVVTGTYTNNDGYSSPADFLLVVEGGQIVSWTMRYE